MFGRSGRWLRLVFVTAMTFGLIGGVAPPASGDDVVPEAIEEAFPLGLPDDAIVVDADTVASVDGDLIVDVVGSALTDGDCASGWVCLWEDADYAGQRIRFTACDYNGDGMCDWVDLPQWGFNDLMSSWKNRKNVDAKWAYDVGGGATTRCMQAGGQSNWVGATDNDQASSLKIFKTSTAC
jgi:hypothetical protein